MGRNNLILIISTIIVMFFSFSCSKENTSKPVTKPPEQILWSLVSTEQASIDIKNLESLLTVFETNCKYLSQYSESIAKKEVQVIKYRKGENPSYTEDKYGWLTEVVLNISIKENAKLPSFLKMVKGVTLHYYIGAGHTPGVVIMKDVAALFYGIEENQIKKGQNTFVANKDYSIVDAVPISAGNAYTKILTFEQFLKTYNEVAQNFGIKKISNTSIEQGASIDSLNCAINETSEIKIYFKQDNTRTFSSVRVSGDEDINSKNLKQTLAILVSVLDTKDKSEVDSEVTNILSHKNKDAYTTNTGLVYKVSTRNKNTIITVTPQL